MLYVMSSRIPGVRGEFLWELEITARQTLAMAEALPSNQFDWRPEAEARSFSEVFVHVATGNFMLLDAIGVPLPADLYGSVQGSGQERLWALVRRNDELVERVREKGAVVALLKRSLEAVNQSLSSMSEHELERRLHFFGEETTVRRVYLRLLAHSHEHMGQLIAYFRVNRMAPPWPDWRPDRR